MKEPQATQSWKAARPQTVSAPDSGAQSPGCPGSVQPTAGWDSHPYTPAPPFQLPPQSTVYLGGPDLAVVLS